MGATGGIEGDRVRAASYHSLPIVALLLLGATPYEDTKLRFTLELPPGWRLAPRFGDTFGMTFERLLEDRSSTALTVHVDPAPAEDLAGFAVAAEAAWQQGAPIQLREASRAKIAGRQAILRESDQAERRVRAYFLEAEGHYYHLRFEGPPGRLREISADWERILASFRPSAGRAPPRVAREPAPAPAAVPPGLVGRWRGAGGVTLVLGADRGFKLGGQRGRWSYDDGELALMVAGKSALRFRVQLDGDALELSAPSLEQPARYTRATEEEPALAGRWRASTGLTLSLGAAGRFEMGALAGQWSERDGRLTLRGEGGQDVTYRWGIEDGVLTLAGGDLEAPLSLTRAK